MAKPTNTTKLTETLSLTEMSDGFWLYDYTRGMDLSMKAKTPQDAFVECITYYQNRLIEEEIKYSNLAEKVDAFVSQFTIDDGDFDY